jgi:hypothetical protein
MVRDTVEYRCDRRECGATHSVTSGFRPRLYDVVKTVANRVNDSWQAAMKAGWLVFRQGGREYHFCPECAVGKTPDDLVRTARADEAAQEKRRGMLFDHAQKRDGK